MTAANVPSGLKYQLLSPLNPTLCHALYVRVLLAVSGTLGPGSVIDRENVQNSLRTSGLQLSQDELKNEQESSVWFSSKWAIKLVNKMAIKTGLNLNLNLNSNTKNNLIGGILTNSEINDQNNLNNNNYDNNGLSTSNLNLDSNNDQLQLKCQFNENPLLIGALCKLWSIFLPHAFFSPKLDTSNNTKINSNLNNSSPKINANNTNNTNNKNNNLNNNSGNINNLNSTNNTNNNSNNLNIKTNSNIKINNNDTIEENRSWRALSLLAFGTMSVGRLIVVADQPCVGDRNKNINKNKINSGNNMKSENKSGSKSENYSGNYDGKVNKTEINSSSMSNMKVYGSNNGNNDDKNDKKNKSSSTMSYFSNIFGFNSNQPSENKQKDNENEKIKIAENKRISDNLLSCKGDIEDYANNIFNPIIHLNIENNDMRFSILITFATILKTILTATDDHEFYTTEKPFQLVHYLKIIKTFKIILFRILTHDPSLAVENALTKNEKNEKLYSYGCVRAISGLLSDLYLRWARRPFSSASVWLVSENDSGMIRDEIRRNTIFATAILRDMPWIINFYDRMKIFREITDEERLKVQGLESNIYDTNHTRNNDVVIVNIRRSNILLDGMTAFEKAGQGIKKKIVVKYIDAFGQQESGVFEYFCLFLFTLIHLHLLFYFLLHAF